MLFRSAGAEEAFEDFLALEFFAAAVAFDDHEGDVIAAFVGGEAALAFEALAAAADDIAFLAFAGVDDFVFSMSAKRTGHVLCRPQNGAPLRWPFAG
mgnify:CR=1 FL=1